MLINLNHCKCTSTVHSMRIYVFLENMNPHCQIEMGNGSLAGINSRATFLIARAKYTKRFFNHAENDTFFQFSSQLNIEITSNKDCRWVIPFEFSFLEHSEPDIECNSFNKNANNEILNFVYHLAEVFLMIQTVYRLSTKKLINN